MRIAGGERREREMGKARKKGKERIGKGRVKTMRKSVVDEVRGTEVDEKKGWGGRGMMRKRRGRRDDEKWRDGAKMKGAD